MKSLLALFAIFFLSQPAAAVVLHIDYEGIVNANFDFSESSDFARGAPVTGRVSIDLGRAGRDIVPESTRAVFYPIDAAFVTHDSFDGESLEEPFDLVSLYDNVGLLSPNDFAPYDTFRATTGSDSAVLGAEVVVRFNFFLDSSALNGDDILQLVDLDVSGFLPGSTVLWARGFDALFIDITSARSTASVTEPLNAGMLLVALAALASSRKLRR